MIQNRLRPAPRFLPLVWLLIFGFGQAIPWVKAPLFAQTSSYVLFAAVLSNKRYVVGQANPGSGLFVSGTQTPQWQNRAFPNIRMFDLEILPEAENGLIYTANGNGVMVSRDFGKRWRVTTGWRITEVLKMVALPESPETVYIGTAYGAFRSNDFGETWRMLRSRFVYALHIDHTDRNRIFIGEEDGLFLSRDGGKTFDRAKGLNAPVLTVAQHPRDPRVLFAGTEDYGIFRSDDRGLSWKPVGSGSVPGATVYEIIFLPRHPSTLLAASFAQGVLISKNDGQSWQKCQSGLQKIPVSCITVHPENPEWIFIGTLNHGVFRSTDGGRTWQPFGLSGAQVMELEIHPAPR